MYLDKQMSISDVLAYNQSGQTIMSSVGHSTFDSA